MIFKSIIYIVVALLLAICLFSHDYVTQLKFKGEIITIHRDAFGIPKINALTKQASFFALGFVTAEDRLFQMHLKRLISQGRLSQLIGAKGLSLDKFFRQLGFLKYSIKAVERLKTQDPLSYHILEAMVEGVNHYANNFVLHPEFYILWTDFQQWKLEDFITVTKLLSWANSNNLEEEFIRSMIRYNLSKETADSIMAYNISDFILSPTFTVDDSQLKLLGQYKEYGTTDEHSQIDLHDVIDQGINEQYQQLFSNQGGSNAWAISGIYTDIGKPILCADPHLQNSSPTQWFQVEYNYFMLKNGKNVTAHYRGGTIAGSLGLLQGKTNYMAWGVTNSRSDSVDLYKEVVRQNQYLFNEHWRNLIIRNQSIKIRGSQPYFHIIKQTHRGPLLSRVFARGHQYLTNDSISIIWTEFHDSYTAIRTALEFAEVQTLQEAKQFFTNGFQYGGNFNMIYITNDDHIGLFCGGRHPIRDSHEGPYIKDGTNDRSDWKGFLPKEKYLQIVDPPKGYIINSNNKLTSNNYIHGSYVFTSEVNARSLRLSNLIKQNINNGHRISVQDNVRFQLDTLDLYCVYILPFILDKIPESREYLANWNCTFEAEEFEASIYQVFIASLQSKLNPTSFNIEAIPATMNFIAKYVANQPDVILMTELWQFSLDFLIKHFESSTTADWKWGLLHLDVLPHKILSATPLRHLFESTIPGRGNANTPNMGQMHRVKRLDFTTTVKANMRLILSYAKNNSFWIVDAGSTEHILSTHHHDQQLLYLHDQYLTFEDSVSVNLL